MVVVTWEDVVPFVDGFTHRFDSKNRPVLLMHMFPHIPKNCSRCVLCTSIAFSSSLAKANVSPDIRSHYFPICSQETNPTGVTTAEAQQVPYALPPFMGTSTPPPVFNPVCLAEIL